jgi:hypothetical protein
VVGPINSEPVETAVDGVVEGAKSMINEFFPSIMRGFAGTESEEVAPEVAGAGWKHDISSRKEREEGLR